MRDSQIRQSQAEAATPVPGGIHVDTFRLDSGESVLWGWWSAEDLARPGVHLYENFSLPERLWARVVSEEALASALLWLENEHGRLIVAGIEAHREPQGERAPGGAHPSLHETLHRFPFDAVLREVSARAARRTVVRPDGSQLVEPVPEADRAVVLRAIYRKGREVERARGDFTSGAFFAWVAETYRDEVEAAREAGRRAAPVEAIKRRWPGRNRSTYTRWVAESRRRGFLGPAEHGKVST